MRWRTRWSARQIIRPPTRKTEADRSELEPADPDYADSLIRESEVDLLMLGCPTLDPQKITVIARPAWAEAIQGGTHNTEALDCFGMNRPRNDGDDVTDPA